MLSQFFQDFQSVFHPLYLLSAFLLGFYWLRKDSGFQIRQCLRVLLKKDWQKKNLGIDIAMTSFYFLMLRSTVLALEAMSFLLSYEGIQKTHLSVGFSVKLHPLLEGFLAAIVSMMAIDFASYWAHRLLHHPWFWWIHRWHHSATELSPFTTYRQNPIEPFFMNVSRGYFAGIALGLWHHVFVQKTPVMTYAGIGVGFFLYMLTVNLHHFHLPVAYPKWLRTILISPHHHHLHHSKDERHLGVNFGVIFSIWDRLFQTYFDQEVKINELQFGNFEEVRQLQEKNAAATHF